MKNNVIRYQFRGELDVDLLAENMKRDNTPIVIVRSVHSMIYILKSFRGNYRGANLSLTARSFFEVCRSSARIHNRLYCSARIYDSSMTEFLSNIKAIIKSHEDASLPVVKVIAIETKADWSGK